MRYRLLGPLAVERDGQPVPLGPPQQRAVLAVLAQEPGTVVSLDRLLAAVWGEDPPPSVVSSLQAHVSRLRRLLRQDASATPPVVRRAGGYVLDVDPGDVDVARFVAGARAARRAVEDRRWAGAVAAGEEAIGWWRGPYLEDFHDEEWVRVAEVPLLEWRAGVVQDVVTGLLGTGELTAALARSRTMLAEQPLVERAAWLHAVALYRAGRPGDALAACRAYATALADELGLDPGPAMAELQAALLRGDEELASWPGPASEESAPAPPPQAVAPAEELPVPLVGRAAEAAVLDEVLERARARSAWLLLTGTAGIGKTRLAQESALRWRRAGGRTVVAYCPDDESVPAWWPVKQLLRALGADAEAVAAEPAKVDADAARFAVAERVREVLTAAGDPLMLVVEDVHWADRASVRLLTFLAETVEQPGLAVVLTARDGVRSPELDRLAAAVARRSGSVQLAVPPLAPAAVGALAEEIGGQPLAAAEVTELARRTGGNAFFVGEYARLGPRDRETVPTAVRSVLRRRLEGIPERLLTVLRAAAVLGDPLDVPMLAAVLREDEDELADLLDEAADQDVLVPTDGGAAYAFAHALLREEVASGLPELRRGRLHLRAAAAIGEAPVGDDVVRRAGHLRSAGTLAPAAGVLAAVRAAARAAEAEGQADAAALWWGAAVTAHDRLPEPDPDDRDVLVGAQVAALTRAGRGQAVLDVLDAALVEALRAGRTGSVGRLASNLLRVSGSWPWPAYGSDPAPLLATLRGLDTLLAADPGARARVLAVTGIGHCYDLDPAVPDGLSARAIALAESTGDPDVLADALLGRAMTFSGVAERSAESVAVLDRLAGLGHRLAAMDTVLTHNLLTMACLNLGRIDAAAAHVEAGAIGSDVLRLPVHRVQLRWAEGAVAHWRGDLRRAAQLFAEAEAAHRRTDLQQSGTFEVAALILAWDQGRLAEIDGAVPTNPIVSAWTTVVVDAAAGRPGADEALAAEVHRPEPVVWTSHGRWALLAHTVADRGLAELAPPLHAALTPLADLLAAVGQIGTVGPVALALARLDRLLGNDAAARTHLAHARDLSERLGGAAAELHCRLLAVDWAITDRGSPPTPDEAAELAAIREGAAARDMVGITRRVAELLDGP